MALSGATPLAEVKEISKELLDHHEIHKCQLEVTNAASDLSNLMVDNIDTQVLVCLFLFFILFIYFFGLSVCDLCIPVLEDKVENLNNYSILYCEWDGHIEVKVYENL